MYTSQVCARIASIDSSVTVINAIDDLPAFDVRSSAYLLNALVAHYPPSSVILGIVDPSVGSERQPICFKIGMRWHVGPDNGIFSRILLSTNEVPTIYRIAEIDANSSTTFHGRDIFAPAAAKLAQDEASLQVEIFDQSQSLMYSRDWPLELQEIVYIDSFGNCMTGVSGSSIQLSNTVTIRNTDFNYADKFSDVAIGQGFWYINSIGLVEIAANQASIADMCKIAIGTPMCMQ